MQMILEVFDYGVDVASFPSVASSWERHVVETFIQKLYLENSTGLEFDGIVVMPSIIQSRFGKSRSVMSTPTRKTSAKCCNLI